jgi:hypothetical protein
MASTKLTEPPEKKANFLNPDQISEYWTVVMMNPKMDVDGKLWSDHSLL